MQPRCNPGIAGNPKDIGSLIHFCRDIIIPPLGPDASPDFMVVPPLAAPLGFPETIKISPDEPLDVVPEEKRSLPETPLVPELLLPTTTCPLEVASLEARGAPGDA